jgi:uncharacterized protein (DUF1800 family)
VGAVRGHRWSEEHVRRVFWRAGFGATPHEASRFAHAGQAATLAYLLDGPAHGPTLRGPEPRVKGRRLDPVNEYGHDVLWWLDRMVRSQRPLVERLTLFWHDHFATSDQDTPLMLRQNHLLRSRGFGSFPGLLDGVMRDPAMQFFLSLADSTKDAPNENFARELMELFTLGGGYTETDVREVARALTGWRSVRRRGGSPSVRWDSKAHDPGPKTIFGHTGRYTPRDVIELVTHHPRHAPFLMAKLWASFTNEPLSSTTRRALVDTYRRHDRRVKPVVAEILRHPALYARLDTPDMVKPPVVLVAGALRTTGTPITIADYTYLLDQMGQVPFRPPSVAGWDGGNAWLSTNSMRARVSLANTLLVWGNTPLKVPKGAGHLAWNAQQHVRAAHDAVGRPFLSPGAHRVLTQLAAGFDDGQPANRDRADMLQRLLRHLMISGPDAQLH